ncbi:MAG: tetratricopeptide repeat protein [Polyangiales bacterium]
MGQAQTGGWQHDLGHQATGAPAGREGTWIRTRWAAGLAVLGLAGGAAVLPQPAHADAKRAKHAQARQLFEQGMRAYQKGELELAAKHLCAAHKLTRAPELAYNLGRVYERMAQIDDAVRYFTLYLRRTNVSAEEKANLKTRIAELRALKERQKSQVFTTPASKNELTSEARRFFLSGVSMYRRHKYQAALQAFTHAMRLAPVPEVLFNIAITAEKLGQTRDAIDYYREYLRTQKNVAERERIQAHIQKLRGR